MRIAIATVQVPFLHGGAEAHAAGLLAACRRAGHEAEIVTHPFRFSPERAVRRSMEEWEAEDFDDLNGYAPDVTICLRFPAWYLRHRRKIVWVLHQHRAVYDLWDAAAQTAEAGELRCAIVEKDTAHLSAAARLFANSRNVAARLKRYNGIAGEPLYHPPPLEGKLYARAAEPFIFVPGRHERLKRQWLLIEAMRHVRAPVAALISGAGGQTRAYERLIAERGLADRVRLSGTLDENRMAAYYACCLGVFFGPVDEDYGYVALEAMLAHKPVITCGDSGGPLEFVRDQETGLVVEPQAEAIAAAIDRLHGNRDAARDYGERGWRRYRGLGISWERVLAALLG